MCAFPANATGVTVNWNNHIQSILDVLQGTTADRVQLVQYNNASNYTLDVRNLDTASSLGLRIRDASNNVIGTFAKNAIVLGTSAANDALALNCNISGKVFIGDSIDTNVTVGLVINQGANDDALLTFKSSDVAHGITDSAETDTYARFGKRAAAGGLAIIGYAAVTSGTVGVQLTADTATDDTAKTTSATGAVVLIGQKKLGTSTTDLGTDANILAVRNASTTRLVVDAEGHIHSIGATATDMLGNGLWFLNDTANAQMTLGLTINQGANSDQILTFKQTGVAHGMTLFLETDTYAAFTQVAASAGGLMIQAAAEGATAYEFIAYHTTENTTKSSAGTGSVMFDIYKINGTDRAAPGADVNLLAIRNATSAVFLFDAEGSGHSEVSWVTYDDHDDLALLNQLDAAMTRDPIKTEFGRFLGDYRQALQDAKIVNFDSETSPTGMVNWTRLAMLTVGAIRQMGERLALAESKLAALPAGEAA